MQEKWFYFEVNQEKYRGRYLKPKNQLLANCIIVPSGQMGILDQTGAAGELSLYCRLSVLLLERNIGIIQFDSPLRKNMNQPAEENHIRLREKCFHYALEKIQPQQPLISIGMSLGSQILLQSPPSQSSGMVLVGCIVDEPMNLPHTYGPVHLVYGSEDYIGYLDDDDLSKVTPIAPKEYAPWTAENLASLHPRIHILQGYGHTLEVQKEVKKDAAQYIAQLVYSMVTS